MVSGYDLFTMIWTFHCLPDSARAAANWAEIAEQLGKIVELHKYSQQNVVADHIGHYVHLIWLSLVNVKQSHLD